MPKRIKNIIVHCSDSLWGCVREIRRWHLENGWRDIGYHGVITNGEPVKGFRLPSADGSIEMGRDLDGDLFIEDNEQGAHALGYNATSVGICIIGKDQFTSAQVLRLLNLLEDLMRLYGLGPEAVLGHYETPSGREQGKTCPNMDMDLLRQTLQGRAAGWNLG